ncbi:MAG: nucleotidyltransferase family protein [Proteobacteria bacterium]|nr:nucleotidyltransferase family protein [Pseudomonadota bacterium]
MPAGGLSEPRPALARAMVLAAGKGTRMAPLTNDRPKPLVEVGGRTMLDRALDALAAAGVEEAVVNSHHLGERIARAVAGRRRPRITLSPEDSLLDTGGGVKRALPHLGARPFYVVNGDSVWVDGPQQPALERLAAAWSDARMDALLLVYPTRFAANCSGRGDFMLDPLGRARRRHEREVAPFIFTGVQVLHPRLFAGAPEGPFSLNRLYDRAEEELRLYALVHDGDWFHIGTPEAIAEVEGLLAGRYPREAG